MSPAASVPSGSSGATMGQRAADMQGWLESVFPVEPREHTVVASNSLATKGKGLMVGRAGICGCDLTFSS